MSQYEPSGWELDLTSPIPKLTFFEFYYSWRIYHPDGIYPDIEYPSPIEGDDWEWDDDDNDDVNLTPDHFISTPTPSPPVLSQFWQERGWLIESQGQKERCVDSDRESQ